MAASVRLYGLPVGTLKSTRDGKLSFTYDEDWRLGRGAEDRLLDHPLSIAMPFDRAEYDHDRVGPFFDGLLPDSKNTRAALARYLHVDASNDYALLYELGRDCPGAVSIHPISAEVFPESAVRPEFDILDDTRLEEHILELPVRPLFIDAEGEMRLSLPGVHHKAAVIVAGGKIGLPRGRTPTSHILKVDIDGLPGSIQVENYCLKLAGQLGMSIPKSTVRIAGGVSYMLIARYDRSLVDGPEFRYLRRLHQEDFCQACSRFPSEKYEKDGGPGWKECFDLMAATGDQSANRLELLKRAVFQFLVNNPDAHAKNYSLLYTRGRISLSKLYDVNNAAAFRKFYKVQRSRVAMSIGGERDPDVIDADHWTTFADEVGFRPELVQSVLSQMASDMPSKARELRESMTGTPEYVDLLDLVIDDIEKRCERVLRWWPQAATAP